mmetsp:Transcript_51120/g.65428  ORF Transcript_51120/g.65428 Transcript_51120/m.65428 type:complete len:186 (-) Transcript_51120:303-860(-)
MAGLWRGIKGWAGGKNAELSKRQALFTAIQSGEEEEIVSAIALARHECVQWKGGLAMSHDDMSTHLYKYLTNPFPKVNRRDQDEVVLTPILLAESLGHHSIARKIKKESEKYYTVSGQEDNAKKKVDAHRGRSTNDRANEARARLKDMQKKGGHEPAGAEDIDNHGASNQQSLAETRIGGRYQPS